MIKLHYALFILFFSFTINRVSAQEINDTLLGKDFDYLYEQIDSDKTSDNQRQHYLKWFLAKAKQEKNREEIVYGYKNYIHFGPEKLQLTYADSMVQAAKESGDKALTGSAYLTKGVAYYSRKQYKKALDNYLTAYDYIYKTHDQYLIYKTKYNLANVKFYLGFYDDAEALFSECVTYFKEEDLQGYLNSLHALGLCYNRKSNFILCSETNAKGIAEGRRLKNREMEPYFVHSEGINQYGLKNYNKSIERINASLPGIKDNNDFANETVGYFYIGKSYWALKKPELAMPYLLSVDRSFKDKGYIRPDLREAYELMITYYKENGNLKTQLFYIERLMQADKVLNSTFQYLTEKIHKEYDTKELVLQKKDIENSLYRQKRNNNIFIIVIGLLGILLLLISLRYFKSRSLFRKKYEELVSRLEATQPETKTATPPTTAKLAISNDVVTAVLQYLTKFEKNRKFLEKDLNLAKMASYTGTNTTYLSQIIFHYKGKKFPEYINDLKVDYIVEQIKANKTLRNYTNKALAEEGGFSTTARFANAFFARTGITPGYFITELQKDEAFGELAYK